MSKDSAFYEQLQHAVHEIFENKNLVISRKTLREDFRAVDYFLPDFSAMSETRDLAVLFSPQFQGDNLSERWERIHRHEYQLFMDSHALGKIQRLPKREFIFYTKPYNSRERFVDNAIRNVLSQFDNVTERFEPGLAGETR